MPTEAATRIWTGAISADWSTAGNWQPAGVPEPGDHVTIASGSVALTQSATVAELTLAGNLSGSGVLTVSGTMTWTSGDIRLEVVIPTAGKLNISGDAGKGLPGGSLNNSGTVVWTGKGAIIGYASGKILNRGTFEAQNDSSFEFCCSHPAATFHNLPGGTFRKRNTTGSTSANDIFFVNEGTIDVQSGSLLLGGLAHELKQGGRFSGAGRTTITTAVTLSGESRIDAGGLVEFRSGALNGNGGFSGPGTLEWTGGEIKGTIRTGLETKLHIAGDTDKSVPGGTLTIDGYAVWTGKGAILGYSDGKINHHGIFEVRNDSTFGFCCAYPVATFTSTGTFIKAGGTNTTAFSSFAFNNNGKVELQSGTLAIGGGDSKGTFISGAGSRIEFTEGNHTLSDGATFAGAGISAVRGARMLLKKEVKFDTNSTLELVSGAVEGEGQLNGPGRFNWSGGELLASVNIGPELEMNIVGAGEKHLKAGKLTNLGTVIWDGPGPIVGFFGGAITNAALFEIRNNASLAFCCAYPIATFVNLPTGTVRKTAGDGETKFEDLLLINQGSVEIQSGVMALRGPQHQFMAGGEFSGAGRVRVLTSIVMSGKSAIASGGTVELGPGGVIEGEGSFDGAGTLEWTAGEIRGKLSLGSEIRWLIHGSEGKALRGGVVSQAGSSVWSGTGNIIGYAAGRIQNSGLFVVENDAAANFCCAYPVATFHNESTGIFRKTGGNGQTTFDNFIFDNDGIVEVLHGTLALGGGGTSSGTFSNSPNGSIVFSAGTMVLNSGATSQLSGHNRIGPSATLTLNGTNTVPANGKLELAGGILNGTGRLTGPGTFEWLNGEVRGDLTIASGTTMRISGSADRALAAGRIRNEGTVIWTGTGAIVGHSGGSITNSGVFEMQNDAAFSFCCAYPIATFDNGPDGIVRKTTAGGTSVVGDFLFRNRGVVDIQTGILALRMQTHEFHEGGRFRGAGRTRIESTVKIHGDSRIEQPGLVELRGSLQGDGSFSGPGTFEWSAGELRGALAIAQGTTVLISGTEVKNLPGGHLKNAGRVVWTGTGAITGFSGGAIENLGIFDIKNDSLFNFCCGYPIANFVNRPGALLRKTSKGQSAFQSFGFVNEGRLSIQAGWLLLADGTVIQGVCPVKIPGAVSIDLLPSNTEAVLTWTHGGIEDGGDNLEFSGFEVERSVDGGSFERIATLPPGTYRYVVPESCDGPVNRYRVRGLSDGCNSGYSPAVSIPRPQEPPVFSTKPPELAAAEKPFIYDADAIDPSGAKVVYLLVNGPEGMTIDSLTGKVQWTPPSVLRGQFISATISAFNGACGAKGTQQFTVAIGETPPPGGFKLRVGKVVMSADSLFRLTGVAGASLGSSAMFEAVGASEEIEDGTFKLGGDIKINDYIRFDGSVVVTLNKAAATLDVQVDQGKVYLTNIPFIGNKTIWQGGQVSFRVDGNGEITRLLQEQLEKPLQAAGTDIEIERARLLLDGDLGIRIFGKLNFPDVYGLTALSAQFDNLEISQKNGIRFTGEVRLGDIDLGGLSIRNVRLNWKPQEDPTQDIFEGEGEMRTPAFELACKVRLVAGGLDGVYANFNTGAIGIPVPPGPTPFLNITGGGMGVEGLRGGPFSVRLDVNVTLVHPSMQNVVSLNKAGITYTYPSTLKGSGDLRLLTAKAAKAYLDLDLPYRFGLGGKIELVEQFPVLIIEADMAAGINPDPLSFFFEGGASGRLQIPPYDHFPEGVKKAFPPLWLAKPFLPKTIAQASIAYRRNTFSTSIGLPVVGDLVIAMKYAQNQVQLLVGQNLSSLTKIIGFNSSAGVELREPAYQRRMLTALGRDRASMGGGHLEGDGLFIPSAAVSGPETVATVMVPPNAPRVIFRLFSQAGAPRYELIQPDGSRLIPENTQGAHYQESADTKETYFVVVNPAPGEWTVEAQDASQGPFVMDAWGANASPVVTSLAAAHHAGNVTVDYNISDPDDAATVALFHDTDSTGFDGVLIAEDIPANTAGKYIWNTTAANLPSGTYSIYAIVDDGRNLPVQRYAAGSFTIIDPNAPAAPVHVAVQPGGENSLLVTWDANQDPLVRGYQVHYSETGAAGSDATQVVDAGKTNAFRLTRLKGETDYQITVTAYSLSEPTATDAPIIVRKSLPSAVVVGKTAAASPPVVRITSPNGDERITQNTSITVSWKLEDADDVTDQQVELSTDGGQTWRPLAKHLAANQRNYIWDVPAGLETARGRIRVSVIDRAGNEGIDGSDAHFAVAGSDSDGDRLPDSWELAHGFDPNTAGEETLDSDGDGSENLQEFLAGTDPKNSASAFRVVGATAASEGVRLQFTTTPGRTYRAERSYDLDTWTAIEADRIGTGGVEQVLDDAISQTPVFYRVRLVE